MRRSTLVILVALAVGAVVGVLALRPGDDHAAGGGAAAGTATGEPSPMRFRNGAWQRIDPHALDAVLTELASRTPGLVRLRGAVRDAHSGEPVAGAEVVFASGAGEATVVADAAGRYTIELPPDFYRAFVRDQTYVSVGRAPIERVPDAMDPGDAAAPQADLAPLVGAFRDQEGVDILVRRAAIIEGTVTDASGVPVARALVRAHGRQRLVLGTDMAETGVDGRFRLEVPAGVVALGAEHQRYAGLAADQPTHLRVEAGEIHQLDLVLTAGCIITGRVVDARGEPRGPGAIERQAEGATPPHDFFPVASLEEDGSFRLAVTDSGPVTVRTWPWKSPPAPPKVFHCEDGYRYEDVRFEVPDRDADLEGTIVDSYGRPVAGAFVDIFPLDEGGMAQQERADAYGEWAFYQLPAGAYRITAYIPDQGATAQAVRVPDRGIRLQLGGTGSITASIADVERGVATVIVHACILDTQAGRAALRDEVSMPPTQRMVLIEDGAFRLDGLPACEIVASVIVEQRRFGVRTRVPAEGVAYVDLE